MNATNDLRRFVDELAAHWTEPVLHILKGSGVRPISIALELEVWHTLQKVLRDGFRWPSSFRRATLGSLSSLMEESLREAALSVAHKMAPEAVSHAFEARISQLAGARRATEIERGLYSAIVRRPVLREAFKEPSRTDFVPHLRVLASDTNRDAHAAL